MQGWRFLSAVSLLAIGLTPVAGASETYDNPSMGSTPCVILNSYQASANGAETFGAEATVENVCGRSVEVSFCFPFVSPGEDTEPHCTSGLIRPWAKSEVVVSDLPSRLAGPDYQWRWHGHLMDSDQ